MLAAKQKKLSRHSLKAMFIRELADYLVKDQARKSIELEMGMVSAQEWARLRGKTPLFGYPTIEQAIVQLTNFLGK